MQISTMDLDDLRAGNPPLNGELLAAMTLGRALWLDRFREYYLVNYIARGHGSKVKVLVGGAGSGKTHLLRCVEQDARSLGYETVFLSLREIDYKLNNLPNLYRAIVEQIDKEELIRGLCCCVANRLGYSREKYNGSGSLLPMMVEEGLSPYDAKREIRKAAGNTFRELDVGPSFTTFCYVSTSSRMVTGDTAALTSALRWISGQNLERHEKQKTGLFERLQKSNARSWLNSLVHILRIAGMTGLLVSIDDLEVMTERSSETNRYLYTVNAIKDTCELFRQLIDDTELLEGFLLLLSGQREIIEDEKRGFKSYEALWMRLESGLVPGERFNPYADIVDVDAHLAAQGPDFAKQVASNLQRIFEEAGLQRRYKDLPDLSNYNELRGRIMESALLAERSVDES